MVTAHRQVVITDEEYERPGANRSAGKAPGVPRVVIVDEGVTHGSHFLHRVRYASSGQPARYLEAVQMGLPQSASPINRKARVGSTGLGSGGEL